MILISSHTVAGAGDPVKRFVLLLARTFL